MNAPEPGLCGGCRYARRLRSRRRSFLRCDRSDSDPSYSRYPTLPVLACPGFERAPEPRSGPPAATLG